jgi:hypothetical protein
MLVNDKLRKCVAFVAWKKGDEYTNGGTAFFVLHRIEDSQLSQMYAVTAAHVIEDTDRASDGSIYLRLNDQAGRCSFLTTKRADWEFHEDERVDVAAMPLGWSNSEVIQKYDHLAAFAEHFISEESIKHLEIAPGEELFFPGLFTPHPGLEVNIPILRTGTLATLPAVQVSTKRGLATVFLAEVRSFGGHSGSPVFVHFGTVERVHTLRKRGVATPLMPTLLGLVHGHIPLYGRDEKFNSGIAAVVPAADILHVLNQPRLVEQRMHERDTYRPETDAVL